MWPVVALLALCGAAQATDEGYLSLDIGFERSSGSYGGTTSIESTSIPFTVRYARNDWSLKLTVPYLSVTGDGSVIIGGMRDGGGHMGGASGMRTGIGMGGGPGGGGSGSGSTRITHSGLGDVSLFASYNLLQNEDGASGLDVAGRIKFGTAATTLGSGENDYALQTSAYTAFGKLSPGLMLGYQTLGSSSTLQLGSAAYGSFSLDYILSDTLSLGASYWYAQAVSATGYAQRELSLYAVTGLGDSLTLRGYVLHGYSSGSPDSGFGLALASGF
jgi:hypothetical protein